MYNFLKFCWRCLQERPRESDAHDCQGAPDVSAFDPSVQNLIRRVLQNYDPSVETKSTLITNPLAADAAAIVTFATTYLLPSIEAGPGTNSQSYSITPFNNIVHVLEH